jgi:hypothetical protein
MKKRKYWYFFTYVECPICGASTTYRERRYTPPRPKRAENRCEFVSDSMCHCIYYN